MALFKQMTGDKHYNFHCSIQILPVSTLRLVPKNILIIILEWTSENTLYFCAEDMN